MFVELYKPRCNIEPGLTGTITVNDVWPAELVINTDCITTVEMKKTEFGSVSYHKITFSDNQTAYITDAAYERLVH